MSRNLQGKRILRPARDSMMICSDPSLNNSLFLLASLASAMSIAPPKAPSASFPPSALSAAAAPEEFVEHRQAIYRIVKYKGTRRYESHFRFEGDEEDFLWIFTRDATFFTDFSEVTNCAQRRPREVRIVRDEEHFGWWVVWLLLW